MKNTYQGSPATVLRDAKQGDPNFDASKDQVVIKDSTGAEQTVLRSDVKDAK
jgi:hypothetical protein